MTRAEFEYWASEDINRLRERIAEEGVKLRAENEDRYLVKAGDLILAGWSPEYDVKRQPDCMSWYWRRPARRSGKGMLFRSTDQAWRHLQKIVS